MSLVDIRIMSASGFKIIQENKPNIYERWEKDYFSGIPGLFSLNSAINPDRKNIFKRLRLDIFYAEHASLGLDLYILYRTSLRMVRKAEQKIRHLQVTR